MLLSYRRNPANKANRANKKVAVAAIPATVPAAVATPQVTAAPVSRRLLEEVTTTTPVEATPTETTTPVEATTTPTETPATPATPVTETPEVKSETQSSTETPEVESETGSEVESEPEADAEDDSNTVGAEIDAAGNNKNNAANKNAANKNAANKNKTAAKNNAGNKVANKANREYQNQALLVPSLFIIAVGESLTSCLAVCMGTSSLSMLSALQEGTH